LPVARGVPALDFCRRGVFRLTNAPRDGIIDRVKSGGLVVLRGGAIGDLILTLPALGALRCTFSDASLTLVGHPAALPLAVGRGYADAGLSQDDPRLAELFAPFDTPSPSLSELFAEMHRAVIWLREPMATTVADNLACLGAHTVLQADPLPPTNPPKHATEHLLDTLAQWGISAESRQPRLYLSDADRDAAHRFWNEHRLQRRVVIALHPGSGSERKRWPAHNFAALADALTREFDAAILLLAGPADADALAQIRRGRQVAHALVLDNLGLVELAALLERCTAYIGNDAGPTHIAAAVGVPTVALFGPSDPRVWGPRGERVMILLHEAEGRPAIPVEDVMGALRAWLSVSPREVEA